MRTLMASCADVSQWSTANRLLLRIFRRHKYLNIYHTKREIIHQMHVHEYAIVEWLQSKDFVFLFFIKNCFQLQHSKIKLLSR